MRIRQPLPALIGLVLSLAVNGLAEEQTKTTSRYSAWSQGLPTDPSFFPIAVWVQSPRNAQRYREAGINLYVGLWNGPTAEQLSALKAAGMLTICAQNELALNSADADIIVGWMHDDEPDNAQSRRDGKGYDPPVPPSEVLQKYHQLRDRDPSRPILLNLGQGVAYDNYVGRGVRRNHPEDYQEYLEACDIASFDIYPVVHDKPEVAGKLEFVPKGVERLRRWSKDQKVVWNCIEASRISNVEVKPTPQQIRSEVWMSLIHGSQGLIYFVHQFEPRFQEASLLDDPELLAAVTDINTQIHQLASVLNSPTLEGKLTVHGVSPNQEIATMCKRSADSLYVFAVNMRNDAATATFALSGPEVDARAAIQVEGEDRQLDLRDRQFQDEFPGYGVHIYRVPLP